MPASTRPTQRRSRLKLPSPANARIRSKLALILVVPIAAILTLTALRLVDAYARASDAERVGALTTLSADVSNLAHQVHRERMTAAVLLAVPNTPIDAFNKQIVATDAAIAKYTGQRQRLGAVSPDIEQRLARVDKQLQTIGNIRRTIIDRADASVSQVILRYGGVVEDLISYREALGQVTDDPQLSDALRAAAAFSKAKQRLGDEQAIAYALLVSPSIDDQQYSAFVATLTAQQEAFVAFSLVATPDQRQLVNTSVTGDAVQLADEVTTQLQRVSGQRAPTIRAADALAALGAVDDLMRWAEQQIDARLIDSAGLASATVQRQVVVESILIVVVLFVVIALALIMARSMIGSLRRLRQAAIAVAEFDLPETVAKLRDAQNVGQDTPDQLADQVRDPIELNTRDEIGEVARAFNMVHREAVRVAAEQAVLRTSVSAMFLGLARRSQTLVDRMIGQLDRIERTEEDPKRLAELFQLDHLATRMRRNDENVLVLADADSTPPRREDAPLVDIMRAAQSEIEMYQRVEFGTIDEDVLVASQAVNDVVRLLAELLDNATRFSPPTGVVVLEARRLGDRVLIQIEDGGLGMSMDTLAAHNARLAAPPALDVATFRMMGLAVVGRLAYRHGITVQLRDRSGAGTIVEVLLPTAALILPQARGFRQLPSEAQSNGRGPGLGALPAAPAGPPGVPGPAPFATVTRYDRPDTTTTAPMPVVPVAAPYAPPLVPRQAQPPQPPVPAPPAPPQWPVPASPPVPVPVPAPVPAANRWADLLSEPFVPAGPGSDSWTLHDETTELPIFREIEAVWFQSRSQRGSDAPSAVPASVSAGAATAAPTASPASGLPLRTPPTRSAPVSSPPAQPPPYGAERPAGGAPPPGGNQPGPEAGTQENPDWRTRADDGWAAARAAAEPPVAGTTRSGLPKRAPQAQLVPGGVTSEPPPRTKRTPDEVRGLLSSYHRGVRRGRAATGADGSKTDGGFPPVKGNG